MRFRTLLSGDSRMTFVQTDRCCISQCRYRNGHEILLIGMLGSDSFDVDDRGRFRLMMVMIYSYFEIIGSLVYTEGLVIFSAFVARGLKKCVVFMLSTIVTYAANIKTSISAGFDSVAITRSRREVCEKHSGINEGMAKIRSQLLYTLSG
ncbi:hypothetical protein RF11_13467 [Thelohanellus kitauei]|uniref:Uncharacterized protein n=1 Tax=Thelohanellus kitauei TaxID=669202 RepID=A0A0C2MZC4_THEKT|nr:hypothetical protein RF11_13467 [Thelohanellus kitauei]